MSFFSISDVARRVGLKPSALRYYEKVGLMPPPPRSSRRRYYDAQAVARIRIIMLARDAGFSVSETLAFVTDYPVDTTPSARWRAMAANKIAELDAMVERVSQMKTLLNDSFRCKCRDLRECEQLILAKPAPKKRRHMAPNA